MTERPLLRALVATSIAAVVLCLSTANAAAQATPKKCTGDGLDVDGWSDSHSRPCDTRVAALDHPDIFARPQVVTPPGAVMKKVVQNDPMREERNLRDRIHRAVRKADRGGGAQSTECAGIVEEISQQQPLARSLRADTRSEARAKIDVLTGLFRERGC